MYYDFELGDGLYVEASGAYDIPVGNYSVSNSLAVGYNNGQFGVDAGLSDIALSTSMDFPLWKLIITPGLNYTFILGDTVNSDNDEFWVNLGASVEF